MPNERFEKLRFNLNMPIIMKKVYDDPLKLQGRNGPFYAYTVDTPDGRRDLTASKFLSELIESKRIKRGQKFSVEKTSVDGSIVWKVEPLESAPTDIAEPTRASNGAPDNGERGLLDVETTYWRLYGNAVERVGDPNVAHSCAATMLIGMQRNIETALRYGMPYDVEVIHSDVPEDEVPF